MCTHVFFFWLGYIRGLMWNVFFAILWLHGNYIPCQLLASRLGVHKMYFSFLGFRQLKFKHTQRGDFLSLTFLVFPNIISPYSLNIPTWCARGLAQQLGNIQFLITTFSRSTRSIGHRGNT